MQSSRLFSHVRRAGGREDKDNLLKEMIGEPLNLFSATLPESKDSQKEIVTKFYRNRYGKIAQSWQNIDDATVAIKKLVSTSKKLRESTLPGMIDNFAASAKERSELMRSDPDFDEAAGHLRSNRNQIKHFELENGYHQHALIRGGEKDKDQKILGLVDEYRRLVYDIAHVRAPRFHSTDQLIDKIKRAAMPDLPGHR
jgi:hypothetical protein